MSALKIRTFFLPIISERCPNKGEVGKAIKEKTENSNPIKDLGIPFMRR